MNPLRNTSQIRLSRTLLALLLAALVTLAAGASQASAISKPQMYKVSFRGDQTTNWKYSGTPLMGGGGCGGGNNIEFRPPSHGEGSHRLTFKLSKPVKAIAYPVGRDAGFYARFQVKATSTLKGSYIEE